MIRLKSCLGVLVLLAISTPSFAAFELERLRLASDLLNYHAQSSPARPQTREAIKSYLGAVDRLIRCFSYNNDPRFGNPPYITPDTGSCRVERQTLFDQWKSVTTESQLDLDFMNLNLYYYQEIERVFEDLKN